MAKRIFPLFVFDTSRTHRFSECDWLICTAKDEGFVAKVTYVHGETPCIKPNYVVSKPNTNGYQVRIDLLRSFLSNEHISMTDHHNLLKKAEKFVIEHSQRVTINSDNPTTEQIINYLELLIRANRHALRGAECSTAEKQTTERSLRMLQAAINKLKTL